MICVLSARLMIDVLINTSIARNRAPLSVFAVIFPAPSIYWKDSSLSKAFGRMSSKTLSWLRWVTASLASASCFSPYWIS